MRINKLLMAALLAASSLTVPATMAAAKDMIVIDFVGEPNSLDPHVQWNPDSFNVYRNIFDNLLTRDDAGEIAPQIATEWKYLSDTEIEFKIRDDVTFHDGEKLTAEDVVFSVKRITDPEFASPQLGQFNSIIDAVAKDDTTIVLTTDGPYPVLFAQLTKLSIVPKHVVEAVSKDEFNANPVGSGPYKFETWNRGVEVILARNDDYWGQKGVFEKASFRAVPDAATRVANLQSGVSDIVTNIDSDLAAQVESSGVGKVLSARTERVAYFAMNVQKAPLDNEQVRLAIAHALDKEGIVEGILGGFEAPVSQLVSPAAFGYVEGIEAPGYDPEKAKEIIAELGDAAKAPFSILTAPVYDQRVVQAIQQMLADVGFNVEIEMTDMGNWMQRMQSGPESIPQTAFSRWSCGCQDADGIMYPILHSSSGWANVKDEELDATLDAARSTIDSDKRLDLYRKVSEIVASKNYVIPLYQASVIYGAAEGIEFTPLANENIFINRIGWTGE
ncbi:ABC transporter substrate-binding protein [Chelativorans sp. AA-79]|uniref:ABC transporter substrate-binding protein n=1 Tax=Chelativorans sp. AA-79 TaxID=3028735 RepID=UPI0023F91C4B|nr:ABC transporter substrate-binding protein [Chelativorans sp. AA-79]WEX08895.1 ABC transporter substrate-binding protein [Chelativorans sp. AA-79]